MKKLLFYVFLGCLISPISQASERGWGAFTDVCFANVGDVKQALSNIPLLAEERTQSGKISEEQFRKEQMIAEDQDVWSYKDDSDWFMIITDYGSCAVRMDGDWEDFQRRAIEDLKMERFSREDQKYISFEYFYSKDNLNSPVLIIAHTERDGRNRVGLVAYNREVYLLGINKYDSDNPPLPDTK